MVRTTLRSKILVFTSVAVLVPLVVTVLFIVHRLDEVAQDLRLNQLHQVAAPALQKFSDRLSEVDVALRSTAENPVITGYVDSLSKKSTQAAVPEQVSDTLRLVLLRQDTFMFIRIVSLDSSGQELVRLEKSDVGQVYSIDKTKLQKKAHRRYIRVARSLQPGQLWLDHPDWNIENGKISEPRSLVMRAVKSLFDKNGNPVAAIVINLDASAVFESTMSSLPRFVELSWVNADGKFIHRKSPEAILNENLGNRVPGWKSQIGQLLSLGSTDAHYSLIEPASIGWDGPNRTVFAVVEVPASHLASEFYNTVLETAVLAALLFFGIIFFGWRYCDRLLEPLSKIRDQINYNDAKDLDTRYQVEEYHQIASSVNARNRRESAAILEKTNLNRRLEASIESSQIGFISISPHGEIVSFNETSEEMFGYHRKEVLGQNIKILMPSPYREEQDGYLKKYMETGKANVLGVGREMIGRRRDGSLFPIFLAVGKATLEDGSVLFTGNVRDLSKEKATEATLEKERAKAAFSSKMASLGEMAGGIAHEVNNPLTIIQGYSRQIHKHAKNGDISMEAVQQKSEKISQNVERIVKIIRGLRAFSREGTGDPPEETKLKTLLENSFELIEHSVKRYSVDLSVKDIPDQTLFCRSVQFQQVIINLINNAVDVVKHLDERWINVETSAYGDQVVIRIINSGPAISQTMVDKIFQPFFTTKPVGEGTGLGLSISKSLVEQESGKLYVDTNHPHTCFVIQIPIGEPNKVVDINSKVA